RGMAGDGQGGGHRLADGALLDRRGAGGALALAEENGDAEPLVAVELDRFHLPLAHRGAQPLPGTDRHLAVARALAPGFGDDPFDLVLEGRQHLRPHLLDVIHLASPAAIRATTPHPPRLATGCRSGLLLS